MIRNIRFVALAVVLAMLLGVVGCSEIPDAYTAAPDYATEPTASAEPTADPTDQPADPPAEKPAEKPAPDAGSKPQPEPSAVSVVAATVVRVVDGDTAVFSVGGREEKVRFIGIDTPESTNSIEPYGKEASAFTAKQLPAGASVWLERDAEERDRYGRMLAYVWLSKPSSASDKEIRSKMLNARLALDGYAQQMTIQPNSKYAENFTRYVREARDSKRGLWALPADAGTSSSAKSSGSAGGGGSKGSGVTGGGSGGSGSGGGAAAYIGNANTKKFHVPSCSSVGDMAERNKVSLKSRQEAISGGYEPCKRCNP